MSGGRAVQGSRALILCLLLPLLCGAGRVTFLSPDRGDALIGRMEFAFRVEQGPVPIERIDVYVGGRGVLLGSALPPDWSFQREVSTALSGDSLLAVVFSDGKVIDRVRLTTRRVQFNEEVNVSLVVLYPVVLDARGKYVSELEASDFRVFESGVRMDLEMFSKEPADLTIALLLDVSSSMREELAVLQKASVRFIDRLAPSDSVSVYAFNTDLIQLGTGATDRQELTHSISRLHAAGGTSLYDALLHVIDALRGVEGRKALFVYSDGQDEQSLAPLDLVIEEAREADVLIYAVGLIEGASRAREDLLLLARETGGLAFFITSATQIGRTYEALLLELRSQYVLAFIPSRGPAGVREIHVQLRHPGLTVRCRRNYYYKGD